MLLAATAGLVQAQQPIAVIVRSSGRPVVNAVVRLAGSAASRQTDSFGRTWLGPARPGDSVDVAAIGFEPVRLAVPDSGMLFIELTARPPLLADLTVFGDQRAALSAGGSWTLPRELLDQMPVAVEPDPLRALALVPSVSFSSPLSARPLIRGYDADDNVIRINGHEISNPYHIARAFSALPPDAVDRISVAPLLTDPAGGGTLAGIIDIAGRLPEPEASPAGAAAVSPVSLSGFIGGNRSLPVVTVLRVGFLEQLTGLLADKLPYSFADAFVSALVGSRAEVTAYATRDEVGSAGADHMRWSNLLLGLRAQLVATSAWSVDAAGSWNRFELQGNGLEVRASGVSYESVVERAGTDVLIAGTPAGNWRWRGGLGAGLRHVRTDLVRLFGEDRFPPSSNVRLAEYRGFGEISGGLGALHVSFGARLDASRYASVLQPRIGIAMPLSQRIGLSLGYARMARLYHLVSDPQPEPALLFPQFWLTAGSPGVPVPKVDMVSATADGTLGSWDMSLSAYVSRGVNLAEIRPETDVRRSADALRFGSSRTGGVEVRVVRGAVAATYAWSVSERRFDSEWVPWKLDRRHLARLQLTKRMLGGVFFAAGEYNSGQPFTPVLSVYRVDRPSIPGPASPGTGSFAYQYGAENSARSDGTLRFDVGARWHLGGPGNSRFALGFSVINAGFGRVAPEQPVDAFDLQFMPAARASGVPNRPTFDMPAVPTITVRWEF